MIGFDKRSVLNRIQSMAGRIAESEGLELVDAEWRGGSRGGTLRVFIDKPSGITHRDCESVSHQLSVALDVEDLIPDTYRLEVSSPGLDRKLQRPADYTRFAGRKARMRIRGTVRGPRHLTGRIVSTSDGSVRVTTARGETVDIPHADIETARLVVEF